MDYANLMLLSITVVCSAIVVHFFAKNTSYVYISVKRSLSYIYILVRDIFTKIPPYMIQRLLAFVSIIFLFTLLVILICVFSVYILPELELNEKYKIMIHYILSLLSLVILISLSGYVYYKNWYTTPIPYNNENRNNKVIFLAIVVTIIVIATLRGWVVLRIYQHSNCIVELPTLESSMSYLKVMLSIEIFLSFLIFSGIRFVENKINAVIHFWRENFKKGVFKVIITWMICLLFITCVLFSYNLFLGTIILICPVEYKDSIQFLSALVNMGIFTPIFSLRSLFSWLCSFKLPNFSFKFIYLSEFKLTLLSKYLSLFELKFKLLSDYLNSFEFKLKSLSDYLSSLDFIWEYKPFGFYSELFGYEPHLEHVGASYEYESASFKSPIYALFMMGGNEPSSGKDNTGEKFPFAKGSSSSSGKGSSTKWSIRIKVRLNMQLRTEALAGQELLFPFSKWLTNYKARAMSLSGKTCTLQHTSTQNGSSRLSICSPELSRSLRPLSREDLLPLTSRGRQLLSRQPNSSGSRQLDSSTERLRSVQIPQGPNQSPESIEPRSRPSEPGQQSDSQPNREQEYTRTYNALPLQTRPGAGERQGMPRPEIHPVIYPVLGHTFISRYGRNEVWVFALNRRYNFNDSTRSMLTEPSFSLERQGIEEQRGIVRLAPTAFTRTRPHLVTDWQAVATLFPLRNIYLNFPHGTNTSGVSASYLSNMLLIDNQPQLREIPEFQGWIRSFGLIPPRPALHGIDYETMWSVFNCYTTFIHLSENWIWSESQTLDQPGIFENLRLLIRIPTTINGTVYNDFPAWVVFDALTGQINMTETRAFIYTRNLVIEFVNQLVRERGGYHSDIHNTFLRAMEESLGNPQLEDEWRTFTNRLVRTDRFYHWISIAESFDRARLNLYAIGLWMEQPGPKPWSILRDPR